MRYCTGCEKDLSEDAFYAKETRKRTRCKVCPHEVDKIAS